MQHNLSYKEQHTSEKIIFWEKKWILLFWKMHDYGTVVVRS